MNKSCLVLLLLFLFVAPQILLAHTIRSVVFSGDNAPGTSADVRFTAFRKVSLNEDGHVAFIASLTGNNVDSKNNWGIWSEGTGQQPELVARNGDQAPGTDLGVHFSGLFESDVILNLNDEGNLSLRTSVAGIDVDDNNDVGIWVQPNNGNLRLVAREGEQVPGAPAGTNIRFLSSPRFNNAGQTSFFAYLDGPDDNSFSDESILFASDNSKATLVAREGEQASGFPANVQFSSGTPLPALSNSGHIAMAWDVRGPGFNLSNRDVMWIFRGDEAPRIVARAGEQAPGLPQGTMFGSMDDPKINASGDVAFEARLTGTGTSGFPDDSIWVSKEGDLKLVVRDGDGAPGVTTGARRFASFHNLVFNSDGDVAFTASLAPFGTFDNYGLWSNGFGELKLVAKGRAQAPGTTGGADKYNDFLDVILNGAGQTAFYASLGQPNRNGIWAEDRSGNLKLIALQGEQLDVDGGPGVDLRTVNYLDPLSFSTTGNEDGQPSWFNDKGQVAFVANFTDGTWGVFVSNLVAIPEPATFSIAIIAASLLTSVRLSKLLPKRLTV